MAGVLCAVATLSVAAVKTHTVSAIGQATIIRDDVAAAREEAIADAKRNALEQVNGAFIRAETAVDNAMLTDDVVRAVVNGFIERFEVTKERRERSHYHVEISAVVLEDRHGDIRQRYLRRFAAVVRITSDGSAIPGLDRILARRIEESLVKERYIVYDDTRRGNPVTEVEIQALGVEYVAEVVINGFIRVEKSDQQQVAGYLQNDAILHFYRCWVDLRAVEAGTGIVVAASVSPEAGVKGAGNTPEKAARAAAANATRDIFEKFLPQIVTHTKGKSRTVTVTVRGIPGHLQFANIKTALQNVRFRDSAVEDQGFHQGGESVYRFDYGERSFLLATKLDRLPHLRVTRQAWDRIECEFLP